MEGIEKRRGGGGGGGGGSDGQRLDGGLSPRLGSREFAIKTEQSHLPHIHI